MRKHELLPNESVRGELRVPQDSGMDPPVDRESDNDIPSAQPQPPPDPVNVVQRNPHDTPPPETLAEALDDLNSSQDLPLQDADLVRLQEFRTKWFDIFNTDSSWQDFSTQCETLADETRSLAQELSRPQSSRTAKPSNNPLRDDHLMVDRFSVSILLLPDVSKECIDTRRSVLLESCSITILSLSPGQLPMLRPIFKEFWTRNIVMLIFFMNPSISMSPRVKIMRRPIISMQTCRSVRLLQNFARRLILPLELIVLSTRSSQTN